jgi:hypothetical protein
MSDWRNHRKPCGEYIFSSIDVPIDACCLTARTIPTANIQRQFIHHEPAMVTSFATREKAVNLDQCSPIPLTLILKLTKHFTPSRIGNRPSQFVIFNHVSNRKIFNSDYARTLAKIFRGKMKDCVICAYGDRYEEKT